jgi:hypothetical protein
VVATTGGLSVATVASAGRRGSGFVFIHRYLLDYFAALWATE